VVNPAVRGVACGLLCAVLLLAALAHAGEAGFVFEDGVRVPMRDGVELRANLFRPTASGRFPAIVQRTPYGRGGRDWHDGARYARAGYVVVVQDTRGRGDSGGRWEPFLHDAADGADTRAWILRQPWSNGRIGTSGGSYLGWTQWAAVPGAGEELAAIAAQVPFGNAYRDVVYSGGALRLGLAMGWGMATGGVGLDPERLQAAYRHLPLLRFDEALPRPVPYLRDWVAHPVHDDYWRARGIDDHAAQVRTPTLNFGGWYDIFAAATLELTRQARAANGGGPHYAVIGPWGHGASDRRLGGLDFGSHAPVKLWELQFRWLEHWLQGRGEGTAGWAPYRLFVMGENRWRDEQEWPLARTRYTPYYLHSRGGANTLNGDGGLDTRAPDTETPDVFLYDGDDPVPTTGGANIVGAAEGPFDQRGVERREDVLVYTTAPLLRAVEVTGPVKLVLWASSDARDTDFTAKLVDVHPDGRAFNLCDGIVRARWRHGDGREALLEPGRVERFEIDVGVTANLFRRGHRIRLEVSSSNFPRFDRNPNSGKPWGTDTEMLPARQTVVHDAARPSHLLLPVIPR
jgi:hypothetical protein